LTSANTGAIVHIEQRKRDKKKDNISKNPDSEVPGNKYSENLKRRDDLC